MRKNDLGLRGGSCHQHVAGGAVYWTHFRPYLRIQGVVRANHAVARLVLRGRHATIALVDDDQNILTSVSIALKSEGYRVTTYTDGASAIDGFKTTSPDLAILDIKMPRMDGMETLRPAEAEIRPAGDLSHLEG